LEQKKIMKYLKSLWNVGRGRRRRRIRQMGAFVAPPSNDVKDDFAPQAGSKRTDRRRRLAA
jgi:hypothetical protein